MDTSPMSRTDLFIALLVSMLFIVNDFCQLGEELFSHLSNLICQLLVIKFYIEFDCGAKCF